MTDNEIIKALELEATPMERNCLHARYEEACGLWCTKKHKQTENCMECKEHTMGYYGRRAKAILSLINRQKAEIERLNSRKEVVVPSMRSIDGNPLNGFTVEMNRFVARTVEDVKAEAYKEFAEEVNKELFSEEYRLDKAHRRAVERILNRLTNKE